MKKCLPVFLGLTLLFSSHHTHTLQTKYQSLISLAVAAVGGIIGYQCNKNISGTRLVESKHNAVIRWVFKKINAKKYPERAAMLYRSLYAIPTATVFGGVAYGITYFFTPWGLSWLAVLYVGNKLQAPIVKEDEVPKNLEDVKKVFRNKIYKKYPLSEMLDELSGLSISLRTAEGYYKKAASDADKDNFEERKLAEKCIRDGNKLKNPIKKIDRAKNFVIDSPMYDKEQRRKFKEESNRLKAQSNRIKRDAENRKWRKSNRIKKVVIVHSKQDYNNHPNSSPPPLFLYSSYHNDCDNDSQRPPGGTPPTGYNNFYYNQNYSHPR